MADYVVKLNGQDNLSPTLNSVKNALNGISSTSTGLDKIQERFNKIENSTAPIKKKLKDIKGLMAQLNLSGDSNSPLYNQMAQAAGSYADALADANDATKRFASDTMNLEAGVAALQGVAAAGTVATGVMGLFGTKNEEVERAILKVQSALAILNGVQTIANILNKDSVLIHKLKQIRIAASAASTTKETAALGANTAAQIINTSSTKKDTIAQSAWNVAKAIGKALLGDFTGLALVAVGAIATYAVATSDATDKVSDQNDALDKQQKALQRQKERMQSYSDTVSSSATTMITSFLMLQTQWKQLSSDMEKNKWIEKNQEEFRKLGLSIKSVTDAENIMINNSKRVVQALMLRASQDALAELMRSYVDDYTKEILRINSTVDGGGMRYDTVVGKEYAQDSRQMKAMVTAMKRNGDVKGPNNDAYNENGKYYTMAHGNFVPTAYGAAEANKIFEEEAAERRKKNLAAADAALEKGKKDVEKAAATLNKKLEHFADIIVDGFVDPPQSTGTGTGTSTSTSTSTSTPSKPKTDLDKYSEYESKMRNLQKEMDIGIKTVEQARAQEKKYNEEIQKQLGQNIQLIPLKIKTDLERYKELLGEWDKIQNDFTHGYIDETEAKSEETRINDLIKKNFGDRFKPVKLEIDPILDGESLAGVEAKIKELQDTLSHLNPELNKDEFDKTLNELIELSKKKMRLDKLMDFSASIPTIDMEEDNPYFTKGSRDDKRRSRDNAESLIDRTISDYENGIIGYDEAKKEIEELNAKLAELDTDIVIKVNFDDKTKSIMKGEKNLLTFRDTLGNISEGVGKVSNAFGSLGKSIGDLTEDEDMAKAALVGQAIGQLALSFASAMKGTFTPWDWIAAGISGAAVLTSLVAQMQSFAGGGVVAGGAIAGDHLMARVNAGEMILNGRQQDNLFRAIDENRLGGNGLAGKVEFEIDGRVIKGVLKNYETKMNKIK